MFLSKTYDYHISPLHPLVEMGTGELSGYPGNSGERGGVGNLQ